MVSKYVEEQLETPTFAFRRIAVKHDTSAVVMMEKYLSPEDIRRLKFECDEESSAAVDRIQDIHKQSHDGAVEPARLDMYQVLEGNHATDPILGRFWDGMNNVPSWVDWAQLERGQEVFYRYGLANLIGFALQGFMGENAATPGIAEVLVRTGGFSTGVVLRRALETFQWILQVTRDIDAIKPGGDGHIATARIRLLHAAVRQRLLGLVQNKPDYFDVDRLGLPINRLDDIHSIALFACNPMWLQLPVMGIHPKPREIEDYIALFRYLGYLLAVPDYYFATATQARLTMEAMCKYERCPTDTSKILCYNFVEALANKPPYRISAGFIEAGARIINGEEFTDAEGLGKPGYISYAEFKGFTWLCQFLLVFQRLFPSFDRYLIKIQRKQFYAHMIEGPKSRFSLGGASKFPMKYDPRVGKMTQKEADKTLPPDDAFSLRPIEAICFAVFMVRCVVTAGMTGSLLFIAYKVFV